MKAILYTDGGAIGNPGPAGIAYIIESSKFSAQGGSASGGKSQSSKFIGRATNNQAEYQALIFGLEKAKALKIKEIDCYLDSQLVVEQLNRRYKIKDPDLGKLFIKIWNLSQKFKRVNFFYIPREKNKEADKLVKNVLIRN